MYTTNKVRQLFESSKALLEAKAEPAILDALREVLTFNEWRYYVENDPVLSDYEYDTLYKKLEDIEKRHPELITPDSPTQRVASDLSPDFPPVAHTLPMLSLGNSYNAEDLLDFDKQIKKLIGLGATENVDYCIEPKFDGGSIALIYEGDFLVRGATRGNGVKGEEMTPNARSIPSIPLRAYFSRFNIFKAEVRGEALIRKDKFLEVNKKRAEEGQVLFANPRNAATGGLRLKDANETRKRELEAFIFQLGYAVDKDGNDKIPELETHHKSIGLLNDIGFKVPYKEIKVAKNIQEAIEFCKAWEEKRESYPYEIDGMVVKVNNLEWQQLCGFTQHHPRWAIAYKFKAKQATTKLLNVEYQVGKVGSITPVAKLDPVHIAGVTVSSVSLHNEEFIMSKDLRIGDHVVVERAGDVIPYIVKSLKDLRDGSEEPLTFPKYCPINDTDTPVVLEKPEGEAAWRCPVCICGAQDLQRMIFHVSKDAMDIDGFGKSYVEKFHELGWVRDIADLYHLDFAKIAALEGFGEKSATNLKKAIEKAKQNPIHRLLHSLSIHHLGKKASKLIAQRIDHVLDLEHWEEEDFTHIKDIGPVVARNVASYFKNPENIAMLQRLEERGVNLKQTAQDKPVEVAKDAPLAGKTILFTGTLQKMGRKEAQQLAEQNGAKNISAVSSNLDILVAGEKAGSKLTKAQSLQSVEIWSENQFLEVIGKA